MAVDANSLTTLANLKAYLGITAFTDDTILERSIDRASRQIVSYCDRQFVSQTFVEWIDSLGTDRLRLKHSPAEKVIFVGASTETVMSIRMTDATLIFASCGVDDEHLHISRVSSTGSLTTSNIALASHDTVAELASQVNAISGFVAETVVNIPALHIRRLAGADLMNRTVLLEGATEGLSDYGIDSERGIIFGKTLKRYQSILVRYTAGYTTIPYDVEQACLLIAARLYRNRQKDSGVASESLGGYSYSTRTAAEVDAEAIELLRPYRRLR